MSSIIEKARGLAWRASCAGGQSHTVEVVVFIVFAAVIGAFVLNPNSGAMQTIQTIWNNALAQVGRSAAPHPAPKAGGGAPGAAGGGPARHNASQREGREMSASSKARRGEPAAARRPVPHRGGRRVHRVRGGHRRVAAGGAAG